MRDFVYVKDCVNVLYWLLQNPQVNGVFNLGSGKARTWNDPGEGDFAGLDRPANIEYIDMPENLRGKYQYFTEAQMDKLRATGCPVDSHRWSNRSGITCATTCATKTTRICKASVARP